MQIAARRFGLTQRSDLYEKVVDQILTDFRAEFPDVMTKVNGVWHFPIGLSQTMSEYLADEKNVARAQAAVDAYVARSGTTTKADVISFAGPNGSTVVVPAKDASKVLTEMAGEIQELQRKTEEVKRPTVGGKEIDEEEMVRAANKIMIAQDRVNALLPFYSQHPKNLSKRQIQYALRQKLVERIADVVDANIGQIIHLKSKRSALKLIAEKLNEMGMTTPFGSHWDFNNLSYYDHFVRKEIALRRATNKNAKPRIRVGRNGAREMVAPAIAAE